MTQFMLNGQTIPRDLFLDTSKYEEMQEKVSELKISEFIIITSLQNGRSYYNGYSKLDSATFKNLSLWYGTHTEERWLRPRW